MQPSMGGVAKGQIVREIDALADILDCLRQVHDSISDA